MRSQKRPIEGADIRDTELLKKQLQREIACLEIQLERLRRFDLSIDVVTLQTYEEMISSRQNMLESLH